jgi:RNA polymerase sigma factor (sigma-70 family)
MNDHQLIIAVSQGDNKALAKIYIQYRPRIKSFLAKQGASKEIAEDVYSETIVNLWLKATQNRYTFDQCIERYLYVVAKRLFLKRLNKFKDRFFDGSTLEVLSRGYVDPNAESMSRERIVIIQEALCSLSPTFRKILTLYYLEDRSMTEVAKKMKLKNQDTAKTLKYKALQQLKFLAKKTKVAELK